jgi:hypothetical protein
MNRPYLCCARDSSRLCVLTALVVLGGGCSTAPAPSERQLVTVTRPAGRWEGRGDATLGFVSESGRLRITWRARQDPAASAGTLRVAVHSAVSGRPLGVIVDHRGDGGGTVDFDDDPRSYNLMVESTGVEWTLTVDELVGVYRSPAPGP